MLFEWVGSVRAGLASIVLGVMYLERAPHLAGTDTIRLAVMVTVLVSIFAHGLSAMPGIALYARKLAALDASAPEHEASHEARGALLKLRAEYGKRVRAAREQLRALTEEDAVALHEAACRIAATDLLGLHEANRFAHRIHASEEDHTSSGWIRRSHKLPWVSRVPINTSPARIAALQRRLIVVRALFRSLGQVDLFREAVSCRETA